MGFLRRECWGRLPFPSPGDLPNPGIKPLSSALQVNSLLWATWEALIQLANLVNGAFRWYAELHYSAFTLFFPWASPVAQLAQNLPAVQETWVWSQGWEDALEVGSLPTPVFWPREFRGLYNPHGDLQPWGCKDLDTTEWLSVLFFNVSYTLNHQLSYQIVLIAFYWNLLPPAPTWSLTSLFSTYRSWWDHFKIKCLNSSAFSQ